MNTRHANPRPKMKSLLVPLAEVRAGDTIRTVPVPGTVEVVRQDTDARGALGWLILAPDTLDGQPTCSVYFGTRTDAMREVARRRAAAPDLDLPQYAVRVVLDESAVEALATAVDQTWPMPRWAADLYGPGGEGRGDIVRLLAQSGRRLPELLQMSASEASLIVETGLPGAREVVDRLEVFRARGLARQRAQDARQDEGGPVRTNASSADRWTGLVVGDRGSNLSVGHLRMRLARAGALCGAGFDVHSLRHFGLRALWKGRAVSDE
ncbi:hypothetical protein [Cellulomonas sp. IC4_254]|uniref:hypothetical protein n=1 Tax=Cellulomonas sp. IC4_254 TaxID=2714040 RepID=UPI00141DF94C|nr:hypothetical protein [Cellulomonas sp. IC4_254]NHT16864.1 hypothetical protein [Cellulomonas sp. IC4_254]